MIHRNIAPPTRDPDDLSIPGGLLDKDGMDELLEYVKIHGLDTPHSRLKIATYIENKWRELGGDKEGKCLLCGGSAQENTYGMCQRCYRALFMQKKIRTVRLVRGYKYYGVICKACGRRPALSNDMCNACLQLANHHGLKTAQEVLAYRAHPAKKVNIQARVLKPKVYSFDVLPIPDSRETKNDK